MRLTPISHQSQTSRGRDIHHARARRVPFALALFATFALALSACTLTTTPASPTSTPAPSATATPGMTGTVVKVYFSKDPDSLNTFGSVFPVNRLSPGADLKTFALQMLIAGPTVEERANGYFSEWNSILTGSSSCWPSHDAGGPDFTVTMNMKGSTAEQGTVTVAFCRQSQSPGIGADARISAEINATLKQFSDVQKVVILTKDGACFGDQSGQDLCLK